ncbi:MAG: hypothetical protein ACM30G_11615 [Micromonosporaceae bacterium]
MRRTGLILVVAGLLAVAGCRSKTPGPAQTPTTTPAIVDSTPTSSPGATASPSGSASAAIEFTVDGAGPYQLDASLASLQAQGLLAEVATGAETCPQNTTARGTGVWTDIRLSFRPNGVLYLAVNRSTSIPTPSGAWLGTTLTDLKKIYVNITGQVLAKGTSVAYLVTTISGRGILFDLDGSQKVISMVAGDSAYLKSSYLGGTDFC